MRILKQEKITKALNDNVDAKITFKNADLSLAIVVQWTTKLKESFLNISYIVKNEKWLKAVGISASVKTF